VQLLLQYGANINSIDNKGYTALHYAVELGYQNIAEMLILAGAETNSINNNDETPVYLTLRNNDIKITELLIQNGGELDFIPEIDPIMRDYLNKRVSIRNKLYGLDFLHRTELMEAVFAGDYRQAELLLYNGADINEQNEMGLTALIMASGLGNIYITRLLLKRGANSELSDTDGLTALSYAMLRDNTLIVDELLEKTDSIDPNALFYSLFEGKKEYLSRLLELSETPDVFDQSGRSLLMYAAYLGDYYAVRKIIENNGRINLSDDNSLSPLEYCLLGMKETDEDYYQIVSELVDNGAVSTGLTHSDPEMIKALKGFRF
ncbi:MAG: ankyrin repeat domain-containing protein, partial [Spirochaetaceae bacterium]|nr:ankyrin repeat domain-containing protein [Spirochaetaceae bacterium]